LHEGNSAAKDGGCKARKITDDATAKGGNRVIAFDPTGKQPIAERGKMFKAFGRLARRQNDRLTGNSGFFKTCDQSGKVVKRDILVRHYNEAGP
jgi:hypothetical protein